MSETRRILRNSADIERTAAASSVFVAAPLADQSVTTHRQFVELQIVLEQLTRRLETLEAGP